MKMKISRFFLVLIGFVVLFSFTVNIANSQDGQKKVGFQLPQSWQRTPEDDKDGRIGFKTSGDPSKALIGYIRPFQAPQQTVLEWVKDEAASIKAGGGFQNITEPNEINTGDLKWIYIMWEAFPHDQDHSIIDKGEQYYLKDGTTMVEVFFMGRKNNFGPTAESDIKNFLSSINLTSAEQGQAVTKAEQLFNQGQNYFDQHQYQKAIEAYEQCEKLLPEGDPRLCGVYDNMGCAYIELKDAVKSIGFLKKSIEINPRMVLPRIHLGAAYTLLTNDYLSAIVTLLEALKIDPTNPLIHENLWGAYGSLGQKQGYDKELLLRHVYHGERFLELSPQTEKPDPKFLKELKYLTTELSNQLEEGLKGAKYVRIFPHGISNVSPSQLKEAEKERVLPNDNISAEEKQRYFDKAKERF